MAVTFEKVGSKVKVTDSVTGDVLRSLSSQFDVRPAAPDAYSVDLVEIVNSNGNVVFAVNYQDVTGGYASRDALIVDLVTNFFLDASGDGGLTTGDKLFFNIPFSALDSPYRRVTELTWVELYSTLTIDLDQFTIDSNLVVMANSRLAGFDNFLLVEMFSGVGFATPTTLLTTTLTRSQDSLNTETVALNLGGAPTTGLVKLKVSSAVTGDVGYFRNLHYSITKK